MPQTRTLLHRSDTLMTGPRLAGLMLIAGGMLLFGEGSFAGAAATWRGDLLFAVCRIGGGVWRVAGQQCVG